MIGVNLNYSAVTSALNAFAAGLEQAAVDALDEGVRVAHGVAVAEVVMQTHRRTGQLRGGFKIRRPKKLTRVLANVAPHAKYIEEGTVPHPIVARRAKFLRFKVGNRWVFRKSVQHPGTKPRPFMAHAAVQGERAISQALAKNFSDLKQRVGL